METVGKAWGWGQWPEGNGLGRRDLKVPCRLQGGCKEGPRNKKRWRGPQLQPAVKKERAFRCFLQLRTQRSKNKNTCGLLKPHKLISKMCSGASKVLVTSFISLFTSKLSLKLSTQKQSLETDWLCVHRNTNTTRYVLVGLL